MNFLVLFREQTLRFLSLLGLLLLSSASLAQDAGTQPDPMKGIMLNLPIFVFLFLIFYVGVIRPQKQQQKRQNDFLSTLQKGDEVVTAGGIIGTIVGMTDRVITLDISRGTEIKVLRSQVQGLLSEAIPAANK